MTLEKNPKNKLVRSLLLVAVLMFGFGYALVPLYNVLCDITGLNGKIENGAVKETAYEVDSTREVTVEFITSLNQSTPMTFSAQTKMLKVHPGEYYTVNFYAENKTDKEMIARAIPSVSPGIAAEFLKKIQCFCFTEQKFMPHESKIMPVKFVIEPKLPEKYKTVTLSYTFFDNTDRSVN